MNVRYVLLVAVAAMLLATPASAQLLRRRAYYNGIQAGLDAYHLAEEQRRAAVDAQLFANDQARAWAGIPPATGETIYYGGYRPYWGNVAPLAGREAAYAYGGWGGRTAYREQVWFYPPTVFEPWPVVPGDIYGYRYVAPVRQPIGQYQSQTGPNRWESHPVYDPPVTEYRPLPPVVASDAVVEREVIEGAVVEGEVVEGEVSGQEVISGEIVEAAPADSSAREAAPRRAPLRPLQDPQVPPPAPAAPQSLRDL